MVMHGPSSAFVVQSTRINQVLLPARADTRLRVDWRPVEPGLLHDRPCRGATRHPDRVHRVLGHDARADAGRSPGCRAAASALASSTWQHARAREGFGGELVLRGGPVHRPAGRARGGSRAGALGRGRGADGHRGLSLVHRLGPRHDDQPRRADADDRAAARGGLHPADLRALRAATGSSRISSRRGSARASITRRTRRSGSSTPLPGTCRRPATARRLRILLPRLSDSVDQHLRGTRFGIGVDPGGRPAHAGRRGLSADVDGREGGRLGGDAAAREGGRDQRAVVQRAAPARRLAARRSRGQRPRGRSPNTPSGRAPRSTRASGTSRAGISTTSWTARRATTRAAGRTSCSPSPCRTRCSTRRAGSAVVDVVERCLLTPVGLRSLAPGEPDYKPQYYGDLRARDAAYHQGTVWAWLIGPFIDAWLRVHPGQEAQARRFLDGFGVRSRRGVHRHDRGDFRRGDAVHPARLRGAGVERRGGAALLGEDGGHPPG